MGEVADHAFLSGEDFSDADQDEGDLYYEEEDADDDRAETEAFLIENPDLAPFFSFRSSSAISSSSSSSDDDDDDDDEGSEGGDVVDYNNDSSLVPVRETAESAPLGIGSGYPGLAVGFDGAAEEEEEEEEIGHVGGLSIRRSDAAGDPPIASDGEWLGIAVFGPDSDYEDEGIVEQADNPAVQLPWDSLQIEDEDAGTYEEEEEEEEVTVSEELEWEDAEVSVDDRVVISMLIRTDGDGSMSGSDAEEDLNNSEVDNGDLQELGDLEWEVLSRANDSGVIVRPRGGTSYPAMDATGQGAGPMDASDYEVLFGQFLDHIVPINGRPPAARSVVESLPSVSITEEDVAKNNNHCAVCKDEMPLEEKVRRLPCSHQYHGECIVPWLGIRNTCPLCRYELPTDNLAYESWRAQRARRTDTSH